MVYGDEDVPFKFAVHLTDTGCRDMRGTLSGNRRLYPSILTKLRKYIHNNRGGGWSPTTETVKGDVHVCQVNGWPDAFVQLPGRCYPKFKCIT